MAYPYGMHAFLRTADSLRCFHGKLPCTRVRKQRPPIVHRQPAVPCHHIQEALGPGQCTFPIRPQKHARAVLLHNMIACRLAEAGSVDGACTRPQCARGLT